MKICRQCAMEIPDQARKCPYCRSWQSWRTLLRYDQQLHMLLPLVLWLLLAVILGAVIMQHFLAKMTMHDFTPATLQQVQVSGTRIVFGEGATGPSVVLLGTMTNHTARTICDPGVHVEYQDARGRVFDVGERDVRVTLFPNVPTTFKLSLRQEFPATDYATATVTITSVANTRY